MRNKIVITLLAVMLAGCSYSARVQRRSNLMSYLYPNASVAPAPNPEKARLQLPLKIGIAFVPPDPPRQLRGGPIQTIFPPDAEKKLTDIVKKSFQGRDWVGKIQMIPSVYLVQGGGFENLEQLTHLLDVDVVALVSVDQLQTSDPRRSSFLYLSVIGAYVLPLDRNETRTLIDAAVFHVPSRTFLLRAPGVSSITGSSTAMDIQATLRERSMRGFEMAMADLSKNLNGEVDSFKTSIASGERTDVDIYTSEGKAVSHGGAFTSFDAIMAVVLLAALAVRRRA